MSIRSFILILCLPALTLSCSQAPDKLTIKSTSAETTADSEGDSSQTAPVVPATPTETPAPDATPTATPTPTPTAAPSAPTNGLKAITHLTICILVDGRSSCATGSASNAENKISTLYADANAKSSNQYGFENLAISVKAEARDGSEPIRSLKLCISGEDKDVSCTSVRTVHDGSEVSTNEVRGDGNYQVKGAGGSFTASSNGDSVMTKISVCIGGTGKSQVVQCTATATANGQTVTSPAAAGNDDYHHFRSIFARFRTTKSQ